MKTEWNPNPKKKEHEEGIVYNDLNNIWNVNSCKTAFNGQGIPLP